VVAVEILSTLATNTSQKKVHIHMMQKKMMFVQRTTLMTVILEFMQEQEAKGTLKDTGTTARLILSQPLMR